MSNTFAAPVKTVVKTVVTKVPRRAETGEQLAEAARIADIEAQMTAIDRAQGVIEFNLDGTVITANENFLSLLGYRMDEIKGKHHSMFVEQSYRQSRDYQEFCMRLNAGEFISDQFQRVGKGGKEVWIQASYNAIIDSGGVVYKVVKYATDIAASKKAGIRLHCGEVFAIGISTGGPAALTEIMPTIPEDFPLPIVIVQHMPPHFTKLLADRLAKISRIRVYEAEEGMKLEPGCALIAPGDFHMRVVRSGLDFVVRLDRGAQENSCRPAVDVLLRSLAESHQGRAIVAILTGMGQDGLLGATQLKALGATILAQDCATSVFWGMPGAIVSANLADAVLPLNRIIPEVLMRAKQR